ncbi:MAG: ABC transporter permease [Spirochaetales bacterium]|nr:ABC transporter permease [Spirochaetales bacterium]
MKLWNIALRNISRNKKRSILSIISTAIATFSIVALFSYIEGMEKDMKNIAFNYDSGEILIRNSEFDDKIYSLEKSVSNYSKVLNILKKEMPYLELSPRLRFPSTVIKDDRTNICFGVAVDFTTEIKYLGLNSKIIEGEIPKNSRDVLMGIGLAEELGLKIGDKFTPITTTKKGASSGITFVVTGFAKFSSGAFTNKTFLVPLTEIPGILRMEGEISEILIKNVKEDLLNEETKHINNILKNNNFNDIAATPWTKIGLGAAMLKMADVSYSLMAIFFFILSSTVIANTMLMVVFERKKEIGTLTAMGMTSLEVTRLFFIEAFYLGILGAFWGLILGIIIVLPLSYFGLDMSEMGENIDFGVSWIIYPQLSPKSTLLVFIYSVFVASFISFFPSKSASKVDPAVALRSI